MGRPLKALALAVLTLSAPMVQAESQIPVLCEPTRVDLRGPDGIATFDVTLADTAAERAKGLMFVTELAPSSGMLFVYDRPQGVAFWMRNTLIPLDMIFMEETGRVAHIHENAVPLDETPIPGGENIAYVLEIPGGQAEAQGIEEGDIMRHPAVAAPLWACAPD